jgi:hypothetical protein
MVVLAAAAISNKHVLADSSDVSGSPSTQSKEQLGPAQDPAPILEQLLAVEDEDEEELVAQQEEIDDEDTDEPTDEGVEQAEEPTDDSDKQADEPDETDDETTD